MSTNKIRERIAKRSRQINRLKRTEAKWNRRQRRVAIAWRELEKARGL